MWRERIVQQTGQPAKFRTFRAFVEAPPPEGLHTSVQLLIHICNDFKDMEAVNLLSQESAGTVGGNNNPYGRNGKPEDEINVDIIHIDSKDRPSGTSTPATMRRLAKKAPELHARVLACEITAHAAALQAGIRVKNLQVPDDPKRAASWFLSHKDAGWLATFVAELVK